MSYDLACHWWRRSDLEAVPVNIKRVAEILYQAEIKVYEINPCRWLTCEPRPLGVARTNLVMRLRCFIGIRLISQHLTGSIKIANRSYKSKSLI